MPAPSEAAEELLGRRRARESLIGFTSFTNDLYAPAPHHRLIADRLEAVSRREIDRLMIALPPRHGKSELASRRFPAWYLGANPTHDIIAASYNSDLAGDFGREVRNIVGTPEYRAVFPSVSLAPDSQAANRWHTVQGGGYVAAGVGTAVTGRGAHCILIDDPLRDREQADSAKTRDRVWDWYTSTAYTRLAPGGAIVLIMCMTGDTPVLMADCTEKPLRDIRPGDAVATCRDGVLSASEVVNWVNQGPDVVYEIRTTSGIVVKANERHPFLVRVGEELKWLRLKDLSPGHDIVRVNGESGRARPAPGKPATSRLNAAATASVTTARNAGRTVFAHLRTILFPDAPLASSTVTASQWQNTTDCTQSRMAFAPSAGNRQGRMSALIGAANSAWTIAMSRAEFAHCFATTATSPPVTSRRPMLRRPSQNTCDFTLDRIVEIRPAGREDVFDIEVAETENFIANGLVSHNTRWHEDDLAGRLLAAQDDADKWEVLTLPAINATGGALWPEWYPLKSLERIRATIGDRDWQALYQQRPAAPEGGILKRAWWQQWTEPSFPSDVAFTVLSLDGAYTEKTVNDASACTVWQVYIDRQGVTKILLRHAWTERLELYELVTLVAETAKHFKARKLLIEAKANGLSVIQELRRRFDELSVHPVVPKGDKVARAYSVQPMLENGSVYVPCRADASGVMRPRPWAQEVIDQCAAFPTGAHDDLVDSTTQALRFLRDTGIELFAEDAAAPPPIVQRRARYGS